MAIETTFQHEAPSKAVAKLCEMLFQKVSTRQEPDGIGTKLLSLER
jgi:hypothetical protein